ncbi:ABC transporter permease [Streptomyces sp. NPDC101733]|uniref:ABC transporter permease n=1 Tax=unclassified Streptomyces TaxID=2593676 RepID=UPI0038163F13
MSTPTQDATAGSARPTPPARARRLRGMAWLMVRQHRFQLYFWAALTLAGAAWAVYQRAAALDALRDAGWPGKPVAEIDGTIANRVSADFDSFGRLLASLPVLLGVFLGAPLIAADREHGTARLVTTQSLSRTHWLLWKLGFALAVAVATTLPLSLLYGWWWRTVEPFVVGGWLENPVFEATGPVLVATAVFTTALGLAVGALTRRSVGAMMTTFFGSAVALAVLSYGEGSLATPRRLVYPFGAARPAGFDGAVEVDQWISTGSGRLYGWGTCVNDAVPENCRASLGIVNSVWEYFGRDQMAGMQWAAAGVLLALGAVLLALFLTRTRRGAL